MPAAEVDHILRPNKGTFPLTESLPGYYWCRAGCSQMGTSGRTHYVLSDEDMSRLGRPLRPCEVLEEEFTHLHGALPATYPGNGTDDERETALRRLIHGLPGDEKQAALCLSGGGIRSATFSLGVLQGLALNGLLERFHYLSTVSGGGYIGSWLSSWIHRESLAIVGRALAMPRPGIAAEAPPIRYLRGYSNYLSPVWGLSLDFFTLVSTFTRNLLLHWAVFVPLMMAVLVLPRINVAALGWTHASGVVQAFAAAIVFGGSVWAIAYAVSDLPGPAAHRPAADHFLPGSFLPAFLGAVLMSWIWAWHVNGSEDGAAPWAWYWYAMGGGLIHGVGVAMGLWLRRLRRAAPGPLMPTAAPELVEDREAGVIDLLLVLASGAAGGLALLAGARFLFSSVWLRTDCPAEALFCSRDLFACLAVPFLLACLWLGTAVYAGLSNRVTTEGDREWWARSGAWFVFASLAWIVANALVIGAQWALAAPASVGSSGAIGGLVTSLVGYWSRKAPGRLAERSKGLLALAGRHLLELIALVFIVVLLIALSVLLSIGLNWIAPVSSLPTGHLLDQAAYRDVLHKVPADILLRALALCAALGIAVSAVVGRNTFSLHAMDENRLVRAFLGATRHIRYPHLFTGFDPYDNIKMEFLAEPRRRLFHVVNIALNLVKPSGNRLEWQQRKAASFTVSPLHSGSRSLAYQPTDYYAGGVSLGRAFTISGAAASPSMGYHSSPLVSFVMAFFNVRLGWWLPNPAEPGRAVWSRSEPRVGLLPLAAEALSRTTDDSRFVYLSDGGHFENLALYEMVYRRCGRIVVVDAGCDPAYCFDDLENAIRKIRVDLGIPITFPRLLTKQYAVGTHEHFVVGRIGYSVVDGPGTDGVIIYVKPVLSGDEPVDVLRYAETNRGEGNLFPQQPTKDQFFDEAQFESYRELGYHSVTVRFALNGAWPEPPSMYPPPPQPPPSPPPEPSPKPEPTLPLKSGSAKALTLGALALASIPAATWIVLAIQTPTDGPIHKPPRDAGELRAPVVVIPPLADGVVDRVMLPFFDEARGCTEDLFTCREGVNLDLPARAVLATMTRALAECLPRTGGTVSVEVRGYSSSSEFTGPDSVARNLALANIRATSVWSAMKTVQKQMRADDRLEIVVRQWRTFEQMRDARMYIDNVPEFTAQRGALNRRVDIVLRQLGSCTPQALVTRTTGGR